MLMDYSYANQAFIDGLKAFMDYTTPDHSQNKAKEGIVVRRRLSKGNFEKRCIQRWAISELINLISSNPYDPIEETTYKLALKLFQFAKEATDVKSKTVFYIAGDFIDKNVIDLFREKEGVYP